MNTWDSLSKQVKDKTTGEVTSVDTRPVRDVYAQNMMAPQYSSLTFPVSAGKHCIYEGELYVAKQNITAAEAWTAAHWDKVVLGDEAANLTADYTALSEDVSDLKSHLKSVEDVTTGSIPFVWEKGGIDNATGQTNNNGSTSRSRDITYYKVEDLISVTNGSSSTLWIIFYTYSGGSYSFASSTSVTAGNSYTFTSGSYVRFDLRAGLSATENITGTLKYKVVRKIETMEGNIDSINTKLSYKPDNRYGGTESSTDVTLTNKKAWNGSKGSLQDSTARASSDQITRTPDMLSVACASGYSMSVYGNNNGSGNALTAIGSTWISSVDLNDVIYAYLFIVIKKTSGDDFSDGTTTGVISIKKGTVALPYSTKVYVDEKDGKKADARYTLEDCQSTTSNLPCEHGAFNSSNGGSYSGSTFPKRGVVLPFLRENNYLKLSAASGYLITVYGNDNGVGSSFDLISNNFEAEFSLKGITKKYLAVTLKKSDNSDISSVDLSDKVILTYATTRAPYLTESEVKEVAGNGDWEDKKILWLGTSIPQQGYPQIVGTMLKADVTNNAEGSSMMRIGLTTYDNDPLGDDLGITGMYHVNVLKSLSMTQAERKKLFLGWTTAQRKAYLMAQGYSSAEVANVVGYANMMSGSFVEEDTDPATSGIPSQKPQDIWAGDGETYKDVREYSYGCCWDDSTDIESDLSVTGKVTGTITGKLKSYVADNDWIFFDHFRNDATDATAELMLTIPTDKYDRHYSIGAFNYLVKQIYLINPNAHIMIIGHYDNDDRRVQLGHVWEAQQKAADLWALPIYKLWEESGIRALTQFTTNGYWDSSHVWHDTGYDGTNSSMNNLEELSENKQQINGTWYHDVSLRQKWMWDDVHPLTTDCKNHIAKLIASWLKKKEPDMDMR